ncbi:MAG: OmpP1/FadL family transporter, partial [Myxococcales bacterium]
ALMYHPRPHRTGGPMIRSALRLLGIAPATLLLASSPAIAAGFEYPDNGAAALGMGGAFVAKADDPTALYYNPAGIVGQDGLNLLLDANVARHDVRFQRRELPYVRCVPNPQDESQTICRETTNPSVRGSENTVVQNEAGWFPVPFLAATYTVDLKERGKLGFGLGAFGPSAVGSYLYAPPDYSDANFDAARNRYTNDPRVTSPQRYALIESNTIIAYPTASVAYQYRDWLAAGASFQYVYVNAAFSQAVTDLLPDLFANEEHPECNTSQHGTCGPDRYRDEDPTADTVVNLNVSNARPIFTGIFGLRSKLHDRVTVGASWRPGFTVSGAGTLDLQLSRFARGFGAEVSGNRATLNFRMPHVLRGGVRVKILEGLEAELDGVIEGWSVLKQFEIVPEDIEVRIAALNSTRKVAPIVVPKNFQNAYSGRLGVEYRLPLDLPAELFVKVRGGFFYETSAVPLEYTNIDFANWQRMGETVGFTIGIPNVQAVFALALIQQPQRVVENSQVKAVGTDPHLRPFPVGNGVYDAGYTVLSFGLRGHFDLGASRQEPPAETAGKPAGT